MAKTEKQKKYESLYKRTYGTPVVKDGMVTVTKESVQSYDISVPDRIEELTGAITGCATRIERDTETKALLEAELDLLA